MILPHEPTAPRSAEWPTGSPGLRSLEERPHERDLHAATVIALADTACGYGCIAHLPDANHNFTTVELKCNFVSTTREGTIACAARAVHLGRATQVWDATVTRKSDGATMALFRCTQMVLPPRAKGTQ